MVGRAGGGHQSAAEPGVDAGYQVTELGVSTRGESVAHLVETVPAPPTASTVTGWRDWRRRQSDRR